MKKNESNSRIQHPDYQHMVLDMDNLEALPLDGLIHNELATRKVPEMPNKNVNGLLNDDPNAPNDNLNDDPKLRTVTVPDFLNDQIEIERLQQAMELPDALEPPEASAFPPQLSMASFRQTPISEWQEKIHQSDSIPHPVPERFGRFLPSTHPRDQSERVDTPSTEV